MITQKICNLKSHKNYKVLVDSFNSVIEMVDEYKNKKVHIERGFRNVRDTWDSYWNGCASYEKTMDLLKNGYIDKVDAVKKEIKLNNSGTSKRITFSNSIVGYAPIVPLAILGVPNSMINSVMKPIKAKVIDIYYDMTCSCGTSSKQIIDCGIKVLKSLVNLEMQGYRLNLYAVQSYTDEQGTDFLKIKIKDARQPIDLKRMSFPTMHTAFFRVVGFDWYSKCEKATYRGGYGHQLEREFDKIELKNLVSDVFGKNAIYITATNIIRNEIEDIEKEIKNASNQIQEKSKR